MVIEYHVLSRWGRGSRCRQCEFLGNFSHVRYQREFAHSIVPRHIDLGLPDPTENLHCNECGGDRRHVAVYDDRLFHYLYI